MARLLRTLRDEWPRLALDILVLILGITLSFEVEEWRQDRESARLERRTWVAVHDDLVADSTSLTANIKVLDGMVRGCDALLGAPPADRVGDDMNCTIAYPAFRPAAAAYEELRQSSNARQLQHRKLFNVLTRLHTGPYVYTADWDRVDAQLVVDRVFPYLEANAPATYADLASDTSGAGMRDAWRALHTRPQFRNLIGTSRAFKAAHRATYAAALTSVRHVLARVDSVVAEPVR